MADACPCGSGDAYKACCKPVHDDPASAPTAETLMRARYSAFVRGEIKFLEESLSPKARKDFKEHEMRRWSKESDWQGLEIVSTSEGGPKDARGEVEFIARYESGGEEVEHHERAEFRKPSDRWYYIDGRVLGGKPVTREEPKVGRNDPCPCGSGKKYKQCHGRAGAEALPA